MSFMNIAELATHLLLSCKWAANELICIPRTWEYMESKPARLWSSYANSLSSYNSVGYQQTYDTRSTYITWWLLLHYDIMIWHKRTMQAITIQKEKNWHYPLTKKKSDPRQKWSCSSEEETWSLRCDRHQYNDFNDRHQYNNLMTSKLTR